jgi:serine/threonine-protein kinase
MKPHPIIFRDLKPDNIIITPDGHLKLIDFGIARYYKEEATRDTMLAGTKGYTAPEVMAGMQSDERSDVYSIGLVFYELLSGKSLQYPPYQIRPVAENNEFLPDYLDEIIAKATNINQTERYASIDEFIYELENIKDIKVRQKKEKRKRRSCWRLWLR